MCEHLSEQHPADTPAFYIQTPYTTKLFKPLAAYKRVGRAATLQEFAYIFLGSGAAHSLITLVIVALRSGCECVITAGNVATTSKGVTYFALH